MLPSINKDITYLLVKATEPPCLSRRGQSVSGHVVQAFVSDTSPKWIDREGLGESHIGTRQRGTQFRQLASLTLNCFDWSQGNNLTYFLFQKQYRRKKCYLTLALILVCFVLVSYIISEGFFSTSQQPKHGKQQCTINPFTPKRGKILRGKYWILFCKIVKNKQHHLKVYCSIAFIWMVTH